jgi:hypothetical protein
MSNFLFIIPLRGGLAPRDLRTAHCRGPRISYDAVSISAEGRILALPFVFPRAHIP